MAFRNITRCLYQFVQKQTFPSLIRSQLLINNNSKYRYFSSAQNNEDAYRDINRFLEKEIQLEKSAQKHPSKLPDIKGFQVQTQGPHVTLTRQNGNDKIIVKFNVTNSVNTSEFEQDENYNNSEQQQQNQQSNTEYSQTPGQLKSKPTFTIDINRGRGQTLAFACSYLPLNYSGSLKRDNDNEELLEDFQIDEFTMHDGEWNENVYSADCEVIDGELYDKLLNLLEEHGIGEEFANQLVDFSTAYEHRQYINLLENLEKFSKN